MPRGRPRTCSGTCPKASCKGGDKLKALAPGRREEIADALFNNAYSALMALGTLSGGTHLQVVYETLRGSPLAAFEMWAACRVRWQERLRVSRETVMQILASKPRSPSPGGIGGRATATDGGGSTPCPPSPSRKRK